MAAAHANFTSAVAGVSIQAAGTSEEGHCQCTTGNSNYIFMRV